jgi:hypothetical protein
VADPTGLGLCVTFPRHLHPIAWSNVPKVWGT